MVVAIETEQINITKIPEPSPHQLLPPTTAVNWEIFNPRQIQLQQPNQINSAKMFVFVLN